MTFITYAQNFEDVLLWRALGHVKNGFYIDVGANDPVEHSITKAFYDQGWHGINIEPMPTFRQAFLEQRPKDINLTVAVGATEGHITLYDVPSVNGWATVDPDVARAHQANGFEVSIAKVPMRTLCSICTEYRLGDIHFLKVDVEGFEEEVLKGMDFSRWRPWIVVVEATLPNSRDVSFEGWEHLLTDHAYQFAYFDGLNRYYVSPDHQELLPSLAVQANVFDEFLSTHLVHAWESNKVASQALAVAASESAELKRQLAKVSSDLCDTQSSVEQYREALRVKTQESEDRLLSLMTEFNQSAALQAAEIERLSSLSSSLHRQVHDLFESLSWRITAPLRWLGGLVLGRPVARETVQQVPPRSNVPSTPPAPTPIFTPQVHAQTEAMNIPSAKAPIPAEQPIPVPVELPSESNFLQDYPRSTRKVYGDLTRAIGIAQAKDTSCE
jgi:FkbM family methyltransferase